MRVDVLVPDDDPMGDLLALILSLGYNGVESTGAMEVMPGRLAPYCQLLGLVRDGCFDLRHLSPVTQQRTDDCEVGCEHLKFARDIYGIEIQVVRSDVFLREHPWTATSRKMGVIVELLHTPGAEVHPAAAPPDDRRAGRRTARGRKKESVKSEFHEDLAGLTMGPGRARAGRRVEMDFAVALGDSGIWEGDQDRPDYSDRLAVQETRAQGAIAPGDVGAARAAAPPLECLRLASSAVMSSDPGEGCVEGGICGGLLMALCGTRDSGQNFELATSEVLQQGGCQQSAFSPCVHLREEKRLGLFHRGDDFVIEGGREDRGALGPEPQGLEEIALLCWTIRLCDWRAAGGEAIECEADPRRVLIVLSQLGLDGEGAKPFSSLGVKVAIAHEVGRELGEKEAAEFRSPCARLGYFALDRPEAQRVAKECARGMAKPAVRHVQMLSSSAALRGVWRYGRQRKPARVDARGDAD
ncbi:unnamed protein product [Prorocentrum cordatum]|uniref:Uncharacterized protein n=1 Tax=Prorocentrum cordatum TaxID=2364126 RepID=A0ABN9PHM3_9DINO|nr:unnamed protein product [Polarella glacialis]